MALGPLSSLGFGSNVLKQDTIDKLKEAEQKERIDPYTKKVEEDTTKQKDLTEIKTKLLSFQTAVSSLADATVFAKRKVVASVTDNPAASLTANSGVALQSMDVNVTQLAQKDVYQSQGFSNDSGFVNASLTGEANLTFFSNGKEYTVKVDKNTTYRDLADKINDATGGEIVAKIVNTGEKNNPYRLTLTSKDTGEDNAISFYAGKKDTSSGKYQIDNNAKEIFKKLGWELDDSKQVDPSKDKKGYGVKGKDAHIQTAQNAEFTLDGIKMYRSSNTVTDLGVGMTLTLNKKGEINFDVQQDFEGVTKAMQDLVDAYNALVVNLNTATDYNSETKTAGTLQGVSEVNSIRTNILGGLFDSQVVNGTVEDANGNKVSAKVMLSMQDFGLSLNDAGTLDFDSSKFEKKVKEDPDSTESFFSDITKYEDINYKGEVIKQGSLNQYLNTTSGSGSTSSNNGLEFKPGDFTIVLNNQTYDLSKNADGTNFKLTGKTEEEMLQNLVKHINDKGIEGLNVKVESYDKDNVKGFKLSFSGDGSSDFTIKGKDDVLKKLGLSETTVKSKPIEGKGIFSKLKATLQGMTGKDGSLTKYDDSLTNDIKSLNATKKSTQEMIDTKYDTMANQWLQYESILVKLQGQLTTVTNMINAANNSK